MIEYCHLQGWEAVSVDDSRRPKVKWVQQDSDGVVKREFKQVAFEPRPRLCLPLLTSQMRFTCSLCCSQRQQLEDALEKEADAEG